MFQCGIRIQLCTVGALTIRKRQAEYFDIEFVLQVGAVNILGIHHLHHANAVYDIASIRTMARGAR